MLQTHLLDLSPDNSSKYYKYIYTHTTFNTAVFSRKCTDIAASLQEKKRKKEKEPTHLALLIFQPNAKLRALEEVIRLGYR